MNSIQFLYINTYSNLNLLSYIHQLRCSYSTLSQNSYSSYTFPFYLTHSYLIIINQFFCSKASFITPKFPQYLISIHKKYLFIESLLIASAVNKIQYDKKRIPARKKIFQKHQSSKTNLFPLIESRAGDLHQMIDQQIDRTRVIQVQEDERSEYPSSRSPKRETMIDQDEEKVQKSLARAQKGNNQVIQNQSQMKQETPKISDRIQAIQEKVEDQSHQQVKKITQTNYCDLCKESTHKVRDCVNCKVLYHSTSFKNLKSILDGGFIPSVGRLGKAVYTSDDPMMCIRFAYKQRQRLQNPILLKVKVRITDDEIYSISSASEITKLTPQTFNNKQIKAIKCPYYHIKNSKEGDKSQSLKKQENQKHQLEKERPEKILYEFALYKADYAVVSWSNIKFPERPNNINQNKQDKEVFNKIVQQVSNEKSLQSNAKQDMISEDKIQPKNSNDSLDDSEEFSEIIDSKNGSKKKKIDKRKGKRKLVKQSS